jgi:hypothetical protein
VILKKIITENPNKEDKNKINLKKNLKFGFKTNLGIKFKIA